MRITRRDFVRRAAASAMVPAAARVAAAQAPQSPAAVPGLRIGMTDWNLGKRGDISKIALAREIGLDGIQVSLKNGPALMRDADILDWPRLAQEYYDIGYRGWYVLETDAPTKDLVADTRANIEYVRRTFRMPPAG